MIVGELKKTSCVLCAQNCGLEVEVENNTMGKVRGDKENPRSRGYLCVKGNHIAYNQHHADRLTTPLKKTENGFVEISWEQAVSEIAERLRKIVAEHGPRSYAAMTGGQGCHFGSAYAIGLMKGLGSRYYYSPLGAELTGFFWVCGRMLGRQNIFPVSDEEHADMMLVIGWNGMESHQIPRAPIVLREFANNPDKLLAVIDPRKSETAKIANIHLPIKPGTDALLTKAMIAIILKEGWAKKEYIDNHTSGFDAVKAWFGDFDARAAIEVCELEYDAVHSLCRELATRNWCCHPDLGTLFTRHSTLLSYLQLLLAAICGRLCVTGGNVIVGSMVPLGSHTDERDPKTWRTVVTDFPAILGCFPPNALPEEILSDHPERPRALIVSGSNPMRSFADTAQYEKAFEKLDLLVTLEIAMTETAAVSDYVLPARSAYESWDSSFFSFNYPGVFFHMRPPIIKPEGKQLECGQIYTRIAEAAGLTPRIPAYLERAADGDLFGFTMAFFAYLWKNPKAVRQAPFVLAQTLGRRHDSAHLSALWGILLTMPRKARAHAARAGYGKKSVLRIFTRPGRIARALFASLRYRTLAPLMALSPAIRQSEELYHELLDHPEGIWIGKVDMTDNMKELKTGDGRIQLCIPEFEEWVRRIDVESEKKAVSRDPAFPFILSAGRHMSMVANSAMRDPAWLKGKRACVLSLHPDDARSLSVNDGDRVRVVTEAGSIEVETEITENVRKGQVMVPHGFGLQFNGATYGSNVNYLTKNTHRDHFAGTPLHRYVPCRIERI